MAKREIQSLLKQYEHPRQIQNLAGLTLTLHQSGKFKGQTKIAKRGRKRLRKALYLVVRPLVVHNPAGSPAQTTRIAHRPKAVN